MRLIYILRILIRYRLDVLLWLNLPFKRLRWLVYLCPWYYVSSKKYTRAQRIRLALEALGPIFIKFGQTLSTRRDLLPDDIGEELTKLQDNCPAFEGDLAVKIIEKSLGGALKDWFKTFDKTPLASASVAQVHSGVLLSGESIVVKVIRPNIDKTIQRDINWMFMLARWVDRLPVGKKLRPLELVETFESIITNELDLHLEADNAEKIRQNFIQSELLYIPKVYRKFSTKNILTLERIYGTPIGDIQALDEQKIDKKKLAEEGVIIFFTQVFEHNFFHADMHPGNIFVSQTGGYIGVDFGIMGSLSVADKAFIADIFLAFFNQDYQKVADVYLDSGWASPETNHAEFTQVIERICAPMFAKSLGEISFGQVLLDLMKVAKDFDMTVQPQLLLLDKTLLNIEGLGRQLYPQLDLWATAKPFLEAIMQEKYSLKNTLKALRTHTPELLKIMPELPMLGIQALKQINQFKNFNTLQAKQTLAITQQLQHNSKRQTRAVLATGWLVLTGILWVNQMEDISLLAGLMAFVFWLGSR
jgi:ubiquinone biosynthesis protein